MALATEGKLEEKSEVRFRSIGDADLGESDEGFVVRHFVGTTTRILKSSNFFFSQSQERNVLIETS